MELNRFKSDINLIDYAAARGYKVDRTESSRNSVVMRHPSSDDKIIIGRGRDNHWTYFSVRDPGDHGSIIDFVQKRDGGSIGDIRKTLRPWIGKTNDNIKDYYQSIEPTIKDRAAVQSAYEKCGPVYNDRYLRLRGISQETLNDPRFKGMVKQDKRKNIIFPHHDHEGLSGFEIKNNNFTGFSRYGVKGVWHSNVKKSDTKLVFTESAIDGLSYHQIKGDQHTRYMSISGQMSPHQDKLIKAAIDRMPDDAQIISAFDHDAEGEKYHHRLKSLAPTREVIRDATDIGKDWNDKLKAVMRDRIKALYRDSGRSLAPKL